MEGLEKYTAEHLQRAHEISKVVALGSGAITSVGLAALSMGYDPSVAALSLSGVVAALSGATYYLSKNVNTANDRIRTAYENADSIIDLCDLQLSSLPLAIIDLTDLRDLNLCGNRIREIPPEITNLINLRRLDLGLNHIRKISSEIGNLINLRDLNLWHNHIREIPPEIGKLINLETLELGDNKITELPPEIGKLTNLRRLELDCNPIREIPPEIVKLTNLNNLGLSGTNIIALPSELFNLKKLKFLYLENTPLVVVPIRLANLTDFRSHTWTWKRKDIVSLGMKAIMDSISQIKQNRTVNLADHSELLKRFSENQCDITGLIEGVSKAEQWAYILWMQKLDASYEISFEEAQVAVIESVKERYGVRFRKSKSSRS